MNERPNGVQNNNNNKQATGIRVIDVLRFLRLAAVRTVIYLVCALTVAGAVIGGMRLFARPDAAVMRLEFLYDGIEKGLSPGGGTFNKEEIRSAGVIREAVKAAGLNDKISSVEQLRSKISIEDIPSDEYASLQKAAASGDSDAKKQLLNFVFFPTKFDVRIKGIKSLGLTAAEAVKLLDHISIEYGSFFKKNWSRQQYSAEPYGKYLTGEEEFYDFIDYYDYYDREMRAVINGLRSVSSTGSSFVSPDTKIGVSDLLAESNGIIKEYNHYFSHIAVNGVSKDIDKAILLFKGLIANEKDKLEPLETLAKSLKEQTDNYGLVCVVTPDIKGGSPIVTYEYPPEYRELQIRRTNLNITISEIKIQINNLESRLRMFQFLDENGKLLPKPSEAQMEADKAYAERLLERISNMSVDFIGRVNATMSDYYDYFLGTEACRVIQSPVSVQTSSFMLYLYIIAIFAVIGVAAGLIVTQYKRVALKKKAMKAAHADGEIKKDMQA